MGDVIKFPTTQKQGPQETSTENVIDSNGLNIVEYKRKLELSLKGKTLKACLFADEPSIFVGGEVIVELFGKKYIGNVTEILQKDENNNVTKIAYTIPSLSGDDPFKFGDADFTYNIETHD